MKKFIKGMVFLPLISFADFFEQLEETLIRRCNKEINLSKELDETCEKFKTMEAINLLSVRMNEDNISDTIEIIPSYNEVIMLNSQINESSEVRVFIGK